MKEVLIKALARVKRYINKNVSLIYTKSKCFRYEFMNKQRKIVSYAILYIGTEFTELRYYFLIKQS